MSEFLDNLLKDIEKLKEAEKLLEAVHSEIGAYGDGNLTRETRNKINTYFYFDDSE